MNHKLQAAFALSRDEWIVFFQAWLLLFACDIGVRLLPFVMLERIAQSGYRHRERRFCDAEVWRAMRAVDIAARNHISNTSCLRRALALQLLLARQGIRSNLQFGVRKRGDQMEAHAWLEWPDVLPAENQVETAQFLPLGRSDI